MKLAQKEMIRNMREKGTSYRQIAAFLNLSENTVKSVCRRLRIEVKVGKPFCPQCGKELLPGVRGHKRIFCSNSCRYAWDYAHRILDDSNAVLKRCKACGIAFYSYPSNKRVYCSHECYIAYRYGKQANHS